MNSRFGFIEFIFANSFASADYIFPNNRRRSDHFTANPFALHPPRVNRSGIAPYGEIFRN
jgi:hypothetical protein